MTQLALTDPPKTVPAAELSKLVDVPQHYLSKIMRKLVAADLAVATKGPGGGFRLSRSPKSIRFADVMDAVDEGPQPDHCAFGWGRCNLRAPCPMHPAFTKLNEGVYRWAVSTTLADVKPSRGTHR